MRLRVLVRALPTQTDTSQVDENRQHSKGLMLQQTHRFTTGRQANATRHGQTRLPNDKVEPSQRITRAFNFSRDQMHLRVKQSSPLSVPEQTKSPPE